MPSFPATPIPREVTPAGVLENTISFQADDGPEVTRARYSRGLRLYQLSYQGTMNDYNAILDFIRRQIRGRAITFDWTYPFTHTITNESTQTPIQITTSNAHGLITGDQVVVTGTTAADGTHTVTRLSNTVVQLQGTIGGAGGAVGALAYFFPRMRFSTDDFAIPQRVDHGAAVNATGLWTWTLDIREAL